MKSPKQPKTRFCLSLGLHRAPLLLVAIWMAVGCSQQNTPLPADLETVEHPNLDAIESVARQQLGQQRNTLNTKLKKGGDLRDLANAFGGMGELYQAYELYPPAATCYRNAERLDAESFLWPYYLGVVQQAEGDLQTAAASFERALSQQADDLPAHLRLGEVQLALGTLDAASEHFQQTVEQAPFAAAGHFGLGRVALSRGEATTAVDHFEQVLELQPEAGIVRHSLGLALRELGRGDEAQAHLGEPAAGEVSSPDRLMQRLESLAVSSGAHLKRGNRALVAGRLDEAVTAFRKAAAADPTSSEIRRNLALVLMRQEKVDDAITELEAAVETNPDEVWLHFDLGNAYLQKRLPVQAVASFQRAVEIDPKLTSAHFNLANAFIGLERWDDARPHLEAIARLDPGNSRARYLSAMTWHHQGKSKSGIQQLLKLLSEEPTNTVARLGLASIYEENKNDRAAAKVYREGLDLDIPAEEKVQLINPLGKLTWRLGQPDLAIVYWRQATELLPESSDTYTNLANALQLTDHREEALELFARAVELDPENTTAWLSEASLWILEKDFTTARERLELALTIAPEHAGLNNTLARLLATSPSTTARNGRRAVALARKAYGLENSLVHAETVGMALAELGQFEEAIRWQRGLIQQAAIGGDRKVMRRLMTNLKIYESRQRVRITSD